MKKIFCNKTQFPEIEEEESALISKTVIENDTYEVSWDMLTEDEKFWNSVTAKICNGRYDKKPTTKGSKL